MNMIFNTIVGWPVEEHKIIEQYKRFCKNGKNEIFTVGKCLHMIPKIIMNSGCPEVDFATIRQEDRPKEDDKFILTIYDDPKKPTEEEIKNILNSFPPIFETVKKDLGITGSPKMYLKEP